MSRLPLPALTFLLAPYEIQAAVFRRLETADEHF